MHYVKDIFEKKESEHSHNKFIRYSKGEFIGPLMKIKIAKKEIKVNASFHFTDELLRLITKKIGDELVHITGFLIWNQDLSQKFDNLGIKFVKVSKMRGIFKYTLDNEVKLNDFMREMGDYNLLVSIKTEDLSLTTKKAFPKPNKPFEANFCKTKLPIKFKELILEEFLFDHKLENDKIKSIEIKHEISINEIKLPQIDNFEQARKLAKRIGELRREVIIDSNEPIKTKINLNI